MVLGVLLWTQLLGVNSAEARKSFDHIGRYAIIPTYEPFDENGFEQYMVYDEKTMLVYVCTFCNGTNGGCMTITPHYGRDSYGQLTLYIYDPENEIIAPAEPWYFEDEADFIILGKG